MVKSQRCWPYYLSQKKQTIHLDQHLQQYIPERKIKREIKHLMICVYFTSVPFALKYQQVKTRTSKLFAVFIAWNASTKTKQEDEEDVFLYTPTFYLCTLSKEMLRDK